MARRSWWLSPSFWTPVIGFIALLGLLGAGMWVVASLQREIGVNAEGLKGLTDKHNTFAERVRDDFNRVREDIKELFGSRRREEAPKSR